MEDHLPDAVARGLERARKLSVNSGSRLCVHDGDEVHRIRDFSPDGMTLDASVCDRLRGRVDIYDGARHLYQALIQSSTVEGDACVFAFKWLQPVRENAPLDFVSDVARPAGLIARA